MISHKLKVGIAGFGVVGQKRRKYIDENPSLELIAVSDIKYTEDGSLPDGVHYYNDYKKLVREELDILFVSLPNNLAADATILGLENNCHVFCEKPPARNIKELNKVIAVEKKSPSIKLKYGFNHRYHQSVKKSKEIIDSKILGEVISFRGVYGKSSIVPFGTGWRSNKEMAGGGILLDQGIHMLDMVRYFAKDFDEIYSFISNDFWKHDVEDNAFILMRNDLGQIASLHSTATQWQHRFRLEIILKEGMLELAGILSGSKSYGSETLKIIERVEGESVGSQQEKTYTFLNDNSWKDEIDEFADCIVKNRPIANGTSYDALKVMEMIFNVYQADKTWWETFKNN
ncbi:MAG: Gfo/Idh/MocA family oxidoreductase [Candidatus Magasanikbacteria bacterium]|jgi:predicted dehydrogenase|nr:Gfo/Idh/MocA family oxidoreductase [Candidatus Magasanikbacteria bacterium]